MLIQELGILRDIILLKQKYLLLASCTRIHLSELSCLQNHLADTVNTSHFTKFTA